MSSNNKGSRFEKQVAKLYEQLGYTVDLNILEPLETKHGVVRSEFDIVYERGIFLAKKKIYVECKYRGKDSFVSFADVTTFTGKLELMDIPYKRGEIVTNSHFGDRSYAYADRVGLRLIDGPALYDLKKRTLSMFGRMRLHFTNTSIDSLL